MKFLRLGDYAEESECQRYTVCRARVGGLWTYQGWRRGIFDGDVATLLTRQRLTIAEDARTACSKDAERIAAEMAEKAQREAA